MRDELELEGRLESVAGRPNVRLELLPGRDHTLRPPWMRPYVEAALDEALERVL